MLEKETEHGKTQIKTLIQTMLVGATQLINNRMDVVSHIEHRLSKTTDISFPSLGHVLCRIVLGPDPLNLGLNFQLLETLRSIRSVSISKVVKRPPNPPRNFAPVEKAAAQNHCNATGKFTL